MKTYINETIRKEKITQREIALQRAKSLPEILEKKPFFIIMLKGKSSKIYLNERSLKEYQEKSEKTGCPIKDLLEITYNHVGIKPKLPKTSEELQSYISEHNIDIEKMKKTFNDEQKQIATDLLLKFGDVNFLSKQLGINYYKLYRIKQILES